MIIPGIYTIQSKNNHNKIYVGSSINTHRRWKDHLNALRVNKHKNNKLQNHFNKYGEQDLQFLLLDYVNIGEENKLIKLEQEFIDLINPYFNICKIAGSSLGCKLSIEACKRIGESKKGNKNMLGYHHTEISNQKNRISNLGNKNRLGYKDSVETRRKYSEGHKGQVAWNRGKKGCFSAETRYKMGISKKIPIFQFDKQNNFIREWDSATTVSQELLIYRHNIYKCIMGRRKSAGGYVWKYKNEILK